MAEAHQEGKRFMPCASPVKLAVFSAVLRAMGEQNQSVILEKAAQKCRDSGTKLTPKRAEVLAILLAAHTPLSAYEIADRYGDQQEKRMPAMSVYRILQFLQDSQLVHKLASENKFVACSHIGCDHRHEVPQFLICQQCKQVKEISVPASIIDNLNQYVEQAGYHLSSGHLELDCLCDQCRSVEGSKR